MRRFIATVILLIQFFVQLSPLTSADDGQDIPLPDEAAEPVESEALPEEIEAAAGSGEIVDAPEQASASGGSIEAFADVVPAVLDPAVASGSTMSDAVLVPVIDAGPPAVPSVPARVAVTELLWMGSDRSTADEWIEIGAFGSGAASLPRSVSGWTIVTVKGSVETVVARFPDRTLSSGSSLLVANYAAAASRLAIEPDLVTTGMALPNTQLLVRLRDASGSLVDEVDDGVGAPMAGANPSGGAKASMERGNPWIAGNVSAAWKTATLSIGFDEGPPIFGTPRAMGTVPVAPEPPADAPPPDVPAPPTPAPTLRLTEIMANPPGVDADEWIEIASFDASAADLTEVDLRIGTIRFRLSGALAPGEHRRYGKLETGLPLPNPGGTVELLWRDKVIDAWTYVETAEGISLGRASDGAVSPQCQPTPGGPNAGAAPDPRIEVQSSSASAGKLSLNLQATVPGGSLAGASCSWAYPDGYVNESCNPPSHSMPGPLAGDVILTMRDYCGNTLVRSLHVDIAGKLDPKKDGTVCTPSAFTGVVVSEIFPNPAGDEEAGEWIELRNATDGDRPLCGWSIDDGERGSEAFALDPWRLPPGETLVLTRERTGVSLNNDADAVRLSAPLPSGGSATVQIERYAYSPEGRSWALRDDGAWAWTDAPTPGGPNVFPLPRWSDESGVTIAGVLPNPAGLDALGGEWTEVSNATPFPVPLTGWVIELGSKSIPLDGVILGPRETARIETPGLPNAEGFARLTDRDGLTRSMLSWHGARDDEPARPPVHNAYVSDLSLLSSDDCVSWKAKTREGIAVEARVDGVTIDDKVKCITYVSALIINKKVEQFIYNNGAVSVLAIDGNDIAFMLARMGIALPDERSSSPFIALYRHAEEQARADKLGAWASPDRATLIDASRRNDTYRSILSEKGLVITPSLRSGVVAEGSMLGFTTNVPASLSVAVGTGALVPYAGPFAIQGDVDVRVTAVSDVQTMSGSPVISNSFQSYHMLKSRYPNLYVSEVFPSPAKGESEWMELFNPTAERVSLVGWILDDADGAGSKPVPFPPGSAIGPGERRVFSGSTIAWNNGGDVVRLIDPRGTVSDSFSYGSVKTGRAFAVTFAGKGEPLGHCITSVVTPGTVNRCASDPPKARAVPASKTAKSAPPSMPVRYRNLLDAEGVPHLVRDVFLAVRRSAWNAPSARHSLNLALFAVIAILSACFFHRIDKIRQK